MNHRYYLITVTPALGWGAPWHELYRKINNAEKRVRELAKKYELECYENKFYLHAERYENQGFNHKNRIQFIEIEDLYLED